MAAGTIKKLVSDRGFGFITAEDGKEYFFHRNELETPSDFDRLAGGESVESSDSGSNDPADTASDSSGQAGNSGKVPPGQQKKNS